MHKMMNSWTALIAITITGASIWHQTACAESPQATRLRESFEPFVEDQIQRQKIVGLALGIVLDGKLFYTRGFGVQKLGESTPVSPRTLFHQASITKLFVATAIMQFAERGQIGLDDLVTKHLEYFQVRGTGRESMTVRQLLNHTSGMPDVVSYDWAHPKYGDDDLERHVRSLSSCSLRSPPGKKFAYSNLGFEVLGDVIAKLSGKPFESYVAENILTPLEMQYSTLMIRDADPKLIAAPHVKDGNGNVVVSEIYPYNRRHSPSSTLVSNVTDMTRWAIANLNRGTLDGQRILDEKTYDKMWRTTAEVPGPRSMGLGWFLYELNGHSVVFHGGSDLGFASLLILIPADRMAVVLMANKHRANLRPIAEKAISATLD